MKLKKVEMINKNIIPEILAPCGSYESFEAAVHAGADACYIGGHKFGARAYAANFDEVSLLKSIEFAHIHGCRLYLTVNTLFKENEINMLYDYLLPFYEHGLDAVIVQDLGVFSFIREQFPDIKIHCSTQMNITSCYGAAFMKKCGASRIVAAREMSLEQIKKIKTDVDIEIEAFVHGAMCYSYSGQCLMSSLAGGRSGNRGRCAQPCRRKYNGEYLLAMKDMCTLENIPSLIDAGIDSFKIEGRMKNEYYVASTVNAYRELVSDCINGSFSEAKAKKLKFGLANIYNRGGFCNGYFFTHNGADMISKERPNHQGVCVGKLVNIRNGAVDVGLTEEVYPMDILEIKLKSGEFINLTVSASEKSAKAGNQVTLNAPKTKEITANQNIFRIKSQHIEEELSSYYKKTALCGSLNAATGEPLSFVAECTLNDREFSGSATGKITEKSQNQAADIIKIKEKLAQTGNTDYFFKDISVNADKDCFIPMGELKRLRREAIANLENNIVSFYFREKPVCRQKQNSVIKTVKKTKGMEKMHAGVLTATQLEAVLNYDFIDTIYIDFALLHNNEVWRLINGGYSGDKAFYLCLPDIVTDDFDITKYLPNSNISGIYIKNIDGLSIVFNSDRKFFEGLDIVCAPSVYAYNSHALEFLSSFCDIPSFELSLELNKKEIKALTDKAPGMDYRLVMYGHTRVMLSNQCIKKSAGKCNKREELTKLTDELGNTFYCYSDCSTCSNRIYNKDALFLFNKIDKNELSDLNISGIRLDFTVENKAAVTKVLDIAKVFLENGSCEKRPEFSITSGHINRGVE